MSNKPRKAPERVKPQPQAAKPQTKPATKRQRVIPEGPTHTWGFFTAEGEAAWRAAGILSEDDAIDLSGAGVRPEEMGLRATLGPSGAAVTTRRDSSTLAEIYNDLAARVELAAQGTPWSAVAALLVQARAAALDFVCPQCRGVPGVPCNEDGAVHIERIAAAAPAEPPALPPPPVLAMPPELAVECPRCKAHGRDAGAVGQPCVQTLDFQLGATSTDFGPCPERLIAARHGDAATIRRKWSLAAAAVAEHLADCKVEAWEDMEAGAARRLYLAALGQDAPFELVGDAEGSPRQPETWPGWARVREQLVPDTIVTGPLAEDDQVVLWPSQIAIITDPKHPHLWCRRALKPPDPDLIGQIEAYGGVREMVWVTMCDLAGELVREAGRISIIDGRRRGAGVRAVNTQRITIASFQLRSRPVAEVDPPDLLTLRCRFTADPGRVAIIKDTANHGRLAEDLLRQADGVANLAKPVRRCAMCSTVTPSLGTCHCGGLIVEKGRSCREIAKLMGLSTQTVANLLSLTLLETTTVRPALEHGDFSVFSGYRLAKEDPARQLEALAATDGLPARERGPAIERFLSGDEGEDGKAASKSWKPKDVKVLAEKLATSRSPEVVQLGQALAYLAGAKGATLKGLPKPWQRALSSAAEGGA